MITVQRLDRETGLRYWCRATHKRTTEYVDNVAVACGGFVVLPLGTSDTEPVTCPDCLARRSWMATDDVEVKP